MIGRFVVALVVCAAIAAATATAMRSQQRVTPLAVAHGEAASAPLAVDALPAGEILFTRDHGYGSRPDLFAMKPDGSHLRLVGQNAANAAVSRDGLQIAFVRDAAIWIMRRDGSGQRRVTSPHPAAPAAPNSYAFTDDAPTWSRDGRTLYFSRTAWETITASIFSVHVDGSALRQLTRAPAGTGFAGEGTCHENPSVSRDGRLIVYTVVSSCIHGFDDWIAEMTTAGKRTKLGFRLAWPSSVVEPEYSDPAWAPNSATIAYSVWEDMSFTSIYFSGMGGEPPQRVAVATAVPTRANVVFMSSPAWSTDGSWLAFVRGAESYHGDIWLVRRDGNGLQRLTRTTANDTAPTWLPQSS